MVLCTMTALASPDYNFTISSGYNDPLAEHIQWCLDHRTTSECTRFTVSIPIEAQRKKYIGNLQTYFEPYELVPHQQLVLAIEDDGVAETVTFNRNEINKFILRQDDVIAWLDELRDDVDSIYPTTIDRQLRFRLFNEVNTFELFYPEDYYYLLNWFYPIFKDHAPEGSQLVISLSGAEFAGTSKDYRLYLRRLLAEFENYESDTLPFDGIDVHGGASYDYWSKIYSNMRTIFIEELPDGETHFNTMTFWSLETSQAHHGISSIILNDVIYEYNSDWDACRDVIKTVSHVLNIPNMQFTTLYRGRGEWFHRLGDGIFDMMGFEDHGCHPFDKGTGTPIYGSEMFRQFTFYLSGYYPDTDPDHVFSTSNVRRYQFQTQTGKYRLVVWRDHGNVDLINQTIHVPFRANTEVQVLDLITGIVEAHTVYDGVFGTTIQNVTLNDNPKLITPTLNAEEFTGRNIAEDIRSNVTDVSGFESGTWTSILHVFNPTGDEQFVEINAFQSDGTSAGPPYEAAIPSFGSLHLDVITLFDSFEGYVTVDSSDRLIGRVEHRLETVAGIRALMSSMEFARAAEEAPGTVKHLTSDWEVSPELNNYLTLVNLNDETASVSINRYDEAGNLENHSNEMLNAGSRIIVPIAPGVSQYRYGMLAVDTIPGVTGSLTRYAGGSGETLWQVNPLQDDSRMVSEIEMRACTIDDAQAYTRIIVINPWPDPVTGMITEKDGNGAVVSDYPVTLAGAETFELNLSSIDVTTVVFKMDNNVRVLGRCEDVITDAGGSTVTASSSKTVASDRVAAGRLVLPWFTYENTDTEQSTTKIRIKNENESSLKFTAVLLDTSGGTITEYNGTIEARSIQALDIANVMPETIDQATGSLEIRVSRIGGISAEADYIIDSSGQNSPITMTGSFEELY